MSPGSFLSSKEVILILILSIPVTYGLYHIPIEDEDIDDNGASAGEVIDTEVGEFQIDSLRMTEDEIIWKGLHTSWGPNETVEFEGVTIGEEDYVDIGSWTYEANEYGLRGDSVDEEQPDLRVLILGTSDAFGHGVDFEEVYSEKLEDMLEQKFDGDIEVINGGIPNAGMMDYYLFVTTLGQELEPDVVIVADVIEQSNIAHAQSHRIGSEVWDRIDEDKVEKPHVLQRSIKREIENSYFRERNLLESDNIIRYGNKMNEYLDKEDTELVISCGIPVCMDLQPWAANKSIPLVEKPEFFENNDEDVYRLADGHYSSLGHSVYAENLYSSLNWTEIYRENN